MSDQDSDQPEILLPPNLLVLDEEVSLSAINEGLELSQHEGIESMGQLLINAFTNFTYGLARRNPIMYYGVNLVARSLEHGFQIHSNDPESKAGAFVRGARIGSFVVAANFDFDPPILTDEICAKYDIRMPTEQEITKNTLGILENSSVEAGHGTFIHYPWLEDCIDKLGGRPAASESRMARAGVGYVIHLASYAYGYIQYLAAQQELARLDTEHSSSLEGVFGDISPDDFR